MGMFVGYARVSTAEQSLHLQRDALKKAGCKRIFTDVASGANAERPGLAKALEFVRRGDTLVVWKLDRLGRSLAHLIESVRGLHARKVAFRSLQESLDTRTSGGKLVFHVFGALAEFERDIIRERTNAGLAAARARGRRGGRPRVLDDEKTALARTLHKEGTATAVICATLGISRSSLYRYLALPPAPTKTPRSSHEGRTASASQPRKAKRARAARARRITPRRGRGGSLE
jgi:DNA invertase Pin-like site-specific DNA recombinase